VTSYCSRRSHTPAAATRRGRGAEGRFRARKIPDGATRGDSREVTSYWDKSDSKRHRAEVESESLRDVQMRLWGWSDMRQRDRYQTPVNGWAGNLINPPLERRPYRDEPLPVVPHTPGQPSSQFLDRRVCACIGIPDERRPCRGCACGYVTRGDAAARGAEAQPQRPEPGRGRAA